MVAFIKATTAAYIVAYLKQPTKEMLKDTGTNECYGFVNSTVTICEITYLPNSFDNVIALDEDREMFAQDCQYYPPWHLSRIVQQTKQWEWSKAYRYPKLTRNTVGVYVLDTFVDCNHSQFQGRCRRVYSNQYTVRNPHGTHVAGLIASAQFGSDKYAQIFSVEVLDDNGRGVWSKLVAALSFVSRHANDRKQPAVINISISGAPSNVVDIAIQQLFNQGILTIVAAGNSNDNACYHSPAREKSALTVAASTWKDELAQFSNWGPCVDIIAPGDPIQSLLPNQSTGYMSGTSMAAPIVAGIASSMLGIRPTISPTMLKQEILKVASKDLVAQSRNTANLMAYQPNGGQCFQNQFVFD
jgi:subtilisin family serine protease